MNSYPFFAALLLLVTSCHKPATEEVSKSLASSPAMSSTEVHSAPTPAPAPTASAAPIGEKHHRWRIGIPETITTLSWSGGQQWALLQATRELSPCIDRVSRDLAGVYQMTEAPATPPYHVVLGKLDRAAAEACVIETMSMLNKKISVTRDGNVSVFKDGEQKHHVIFGAGKAIWHQDRKAAEAMWESTSSKTVNPALAALNDRVSLPGAQLLVFSTLDYFGVLTGVSSQGMAGGMGSTGMPEVVVPFTDAPTASRALDALNKKMTDAAVAPPIQRALSLVEAKTNGNMVSIQFAPEVFKVSGLAEALAALIAQHKSTP